MRKYRMLAPNVRVEYVSDLLGQPAFQKTYVRERPSTGERAPPGSTEPAQFVERVWKLADDGYLQVVSDPEGSVLRYSLTSTSWWFRPRIPMGSTPGGEPEFVVKLGVTRFSQLPGLEGGCEAVYRLLGARRYEYRELYYYGNPGGYATWACSFNDAGRGPVFALPNEIPDPPWGQFGFVEEWVTQLSQQQRQVLHAARRGTAVNTVTVTITLDDLADQVRYGADLDTVRMLPNRRSWQTKVYARWTRCHL
jgi:hypothetical protein